LLQRERWASKPLQFYTAPVYPALPLYINVEFFSG